MEHTAYLLKRAVIKWETKSCRRRRTYLHYTSVVTTRVSVPLPAQLTPHRTKITYYYYTERWSFTHEDFNEERHENHISALLQLRI